MSRYERRNLTTIGSPSHKTILCFLTPLLFSFSLFIALLHNRLDWSHSFSCQGRQGFHRFAARCTCQCSPIRTPTTTWRSCLSHVGESRSIWCLFMLMNSVTVLRDRETRQSKGVAWIQFVECVDGFFDNAIAENRHKRPSTN